MPSTRRSAYLFSVLSLAFIALSCHRALRIPAGVPAGPEGVPEIRVRLVRGASTVALGGGVNPVLLTDAASGAKIARVPAGQKWDAVIFNGTELRVATPDGRVSRPHPSGIRAEAEGEPRLVEISGKLYRGGATILIETQKSLTVINSLPLEHYLRSVAPAEIGNLDGKLIEALKAQAVASRSYALAQIERNRAFAFDLSAETDDQVYKGVGGETALADRAVSETRGECLYYRGKVITAFYHSTCGGRTADPAEVWGDQFAANNPYLESVKDGDRDRESKWDTWSVKWTRRDLLEGIRKALPSAVGLSAAEIGEPTDIEVLEKGRSGRNVLLKVTTDKRILQIKGDQIRSVLRQPGGGLLPSTFFNLAISREPSGPVITAEGRGFGHGLGMCQTGAKARADAGESYSRILKSYYKGVEVVKIY